MWLGIVNQKMCVTCGWELGTKKCVLHVVENWDGVQLAVVALLADDWRTPYSPTEQLEQHQFSQLAGKQENHTVLTSSDQSRRISKRRQNLENTHSCSTAGDEAAAL